MNDDLIARLRDNEIYQDLHGVAADAIAALVAENAKLRTDHASIVGAYDNKVADALEALQAAPKQCHGVADPDCDYLAVCGQGCNKCGRVHRPHVMEARAREWLKLTSAAPPQPLTLSDEQIESILAEFDVDLEAWKPLARAIERAVRRSSHKS